MGMLDICIAPGCERQMGRSGAKKMCFMHYSRKGVYEWITHLDDIGEFDKGWFIGLFEGEGSVSNLGTNNIQISITMTDLDTVVRAQSIVRLGNITGPYPAPRSDKEVWYFKIGKNVEALALLEWMLSHLSERRRQRAEEAIERIKCSRTYKILCEGVE